MIYLNELCDHDLKDIIKCSNRLNCDELLSFISRLEIIINEVKNDMNKNSELQSQYGV